MKINKDCKIENSNDLINLMKDYIIDLEDFKKYDKNKAFCHEITINESELFIFLTSKTLLTNILKQKIYDESIIAIDATYNTNLLHLPLIILGTIDLDHKFHLVNMVLLKSETELAYEKIFSKFRDIINHTFHPFVLHLKYVLSDGDLSIRNAAKKVFPDIQNILCYFNMLKRISHKLSQKDYCPTAKLTDDYIHILP